MEQKVHGKLDVPTPARADLGRRLKAVRDRNELGQESVGELFNKTHSAIGQWERGNVLIESINLILFAQHFRESLDWLVFGMKGNIEKRIEALPDALRDAIQVQIMSTIDNAEKMVQRNPKLFPREVVPDGDPRLTKWSAADKPKARQRAKKGGKGSS